MTSRPQARSFFSRVASALAFATVATAGLLGASCKWDKMPFKPGDTRTFAGEVEVSGAELNKGYQSYMRYCYACHGEKGDGKGPSSYSLRPPPRDFTRGVFKFARMSSSDDYPNDADLVRIVKGGLHGTAMLPWDIPDEELLRVLNYIKTFGPLTEEGEQTHEGSRWEKIRKKTGKVYPVLDEWTPEPDPWGGKEAEAIQLGKELYHLRAECVNCHPGYDTKENLYKMSVEAAKRAPDKFSVLKGFRDDLYHSQPKKSDEYGVQIMPPDFTMDFVRSAHPETRIQDLYRILSFGVYPIMPKWKGAGLSDAEIYAIAHYVNSLIEMRGKTEALDLKQQVNEQKPFDIPKPEEAKPAEQPADAAEGDKKEGDPADKKDAPADAKKDTPADAKKDEAKKDEAKKDDAKKD
ncbi:MAG: c-type cytochrome [Polyangiaceae bacterium]